MPTSQQRSTQSGFDLLLLHDNGVQGLTHPRFPQFLRLESALAVVHHPLSFVAQIRSQYFDRVIGRVDRPGHDFGYSAQTLDLFGQQDGVLKFLTGMHFQFLRYIRVLGVPHQPAVPSARNNRRVFLRQIFNQELYKPFASDAKS